MLLLATGLIAILAGVPILRGVAGTGVRMAPWGRGEWLVFCTERQTGEDPRGSAFLEDAQSQVAVAERNQDQRG